MPNLKNILKRISKILAKAKSKKTLNGYALIGGFAVSARAKPRATRDIDFLIEAEPDFYTDTLPNLLKKTDYTFKIFISSFEDPLHKLIRIYDKERNEVVDLIPVFWNWQSAIIENADNIEVSRGISIPIAKAEDLIVMKLKAGGPQDLVDVRALLEALNETKKFNPQKMIEFAKRAKVDKKLQRLI